MKKKKLIFPILGIMMLCSCGKQQTEENAESIAPVVIAQNDWTGGFSRLAAIQTDVINIVSILDTHNYDIIMGNPSDYWDEDEYYYLHFIPMDSDMMLSTLYLNETDDETVMQQNVTANLQAMGYENPTVAKTAKHEYLIRYSGTFTDRQTYETYPAKRTVTCIYDAAHDRMQAVSVTRNTSTLEEQEDAFYEFAELGNGKYAFQNEKERMYVEYYDTGELKLFAYSELASPEQNEEEEETEQNGQNLEDFIMDITENDSSGDEADSGSENQDQETDMQSEEKENYGAFYLSAENSIYSHLDGICAEWVSAADNLKTFITYQDNVLSVSMQNRLTEQMESFSVVGREEEDESVQELSEEPQTAADGTEK